MISQNMRNTKCLTLYLGNCPIFIAFWYNHLVNKALVLKQTQEFVRKRMEKESTGHDWWHIERVLRMAKHIAKAEQNCNMFIIELAAFLHDIADWKFHKGDDTVGPEVARKWLKELKVENSIILHVCNIVKNISFKGAGVANKIKTKEGMIVQDADRLDALGAIGIARAFATGSKFNIEIYNPNVKPKKHKTFQEYKKERGTTVNHFHEKLLLLKDIMNTETARKIAEERHGFMEQYLKEFYREWKGQ